MAKPLKAKLKECEDNIDNDGDGNIDYPDDTGCTRAKDNDESDCGDGVCEGEETAENCPEDCGTPDSCDDTDGGYVPGVQGTASGYLNEIWYSDTDYCLDSSTLVEYYCVGDYEYNSIGPCMNSTTCVNGACV